MFLLRSRPWAWTACLLLIVFAAGTAMAQTVIRDPHVPGELIIKFKPHATEAQKNAILRTLGATTLTTYKTLPFKLHAISETNVESAIDMYRNNPLIDIIEPNYIVTLNETPDDPRFDELWGMENTGQTGGTPGADISATSAWDVFTGSSDVVVGVIDTGVDYTHPDLIDNMWTNPGEIPDNGIDDDGNGYIDDYYGWDFYNNDNDPMDDNGHGSHCSGTIGATGNNGVGVVGVNWDVSIMAIKFLSGGGSGSTAGAISAVEYATMMGVDLTNNSWGGGGYSAALEIAIADAGAADILFIAAAGNGSTNTDLNPHYPSSYTLDNIISVANTTHNDVLSSLSNWGLVSVDLAAPGSSILSTTPGNSYTLLSGTSMATPHVAGVAALVKGRFPSIGALDNKALILNGADLIPALDGMVLTGARLNAFMPIADPDDIPPAQITDLAVLTAGSNWLDVQWSAVGDDGMVGDASRYDLRVATFMIDETNFDTATRVNGTPDPGPPGTLEMMRVDGLDFTTTYYLAVKALDEFGNAGDVSNVPMGTTLGAPTVSTTPASFTEDLLTGETARQTLTIANVGQGTLDFVLPTPTLLGGEIVTNAYVEMPKGMEDTRVGEPVIDASGGPDNFGYRWIDSNDPQGPTYAWTDISGIGNVALSTGDDVTGGPFPISFPFTYYGADHSQFYVMDNGYLSLTSTVSAPGNQQLPNPGAAGNMIAPFWTDLELSIGTVYYYDDGTRLIVQWEGVIPYNGDGSITYTFQAILNADGSVLFQYGPMSDPSNVATLGLQNADGSDGLQVAFNTPYVADGLAVRIFAVPQWVTVTPREGTVWAGGDMLVDVDFDAAGLVGGTYDGFIRVVSNDPVTPDYNIPVQLSVTGAPDIAVDPLSYDFGDLFLGATATTQVVVRNIGTDLLTISSITIDDGAFTADQSAFALAPGATQIVNVTFNPAVVQPYTATMAVNSDDPTDPVMNVALSGAALDPPAFSVDPMSLASALYTGETDNQALTLANSGGADFEYQLSIDFKSNVTVYEDLVLAKEEADPRPGILGTGGPDVYGYRWIDSDEPGGPAFEWTDISATGTPVFSGTNDDRNVGPFPIGFDFGFYGNTFSEFRISSNGFISFTSTSSDLGNSPLPGTGAPENLLAMFHDDLRVDTNAGSNVYYENVGNKLIVQFDQVPKYYTSGALTFQAHLYPNGTIFYYYLTMTDATLTSATIGIQNDTQDDGLTVVYNADYVHDNMAIRFQAFPEWLTVNPAGGTVAPGGSDIVDVAFNATGLFGGTYEADIVIVSNDPSLPIFPVPVTLDVTGAPDLQVSATSFDFGTQFVGTPSLQNLAVANAGTDDLVITDIVFSHGDFGSSLGAPLTLGPTQTALGTVIFNPSSVGEITGTMTLTSNDPTNPTMVIDLTGIGLLPPAAGVTPESLVADLFTGGVDVQTLTVSNTGDSDLDFTATTLLGASEIEVHADLELAKGEVDPRPGILGSGGPDLYGYRWKDSDEPGGPLFEWTDISATGTPIFSGVNDDRNVGPFPIGFTFPFYGNPFDTFRLSSNGFISFTSTSSDLGNSPLPGTGAPENLLAMFHDDLRVDTNAGSNVYYENVGNKLIVQFDQVPKYYTSGALTFQAHLYPNGTIFYYYLTMTDATLTSATIGIQNATQDDGLTVVYNDDYVHDNLAIRLAPVSDWLTVVPDAGSVAPGASTDLAVTFNADELFGGVYEGAVRINSNDPTNALIEVPATMTVTGVPVAAADPAALDFGDVFIGYPYEQQFVVANEGTDLLTVTDIVPGSGDYLVAPTNFALDPFEVQLVTVTFLPSAEGDLGTDLLVMSNDASSPLVVPVAANGIVPPVVAWDPTELEGAALPGTTKTKYVEVCNTGGSDLTWSMSENQDQMATAVYEYLEIGKEQPDPRPGILGSGGPDMFGYTWIDSDDPGGPTYDWVDISAVGTATFSGYSDDGNRGPFPIGFPFAFYGESFTEFNVCSNGWLSFTNTSSPYSNQPLPNAGAPENMLALYWDDMVVDPNDDGEIFYHFDGTRLIVQYEIRRIATGGSPPFYSMQMMLYPDGTIVYQYDGLGTNQDSATIGMQNGTQDDGLMMVFNDTYVHEGLAIRISAAPDWLSVPVSSGVVAVGECAQIAVLMNATELDAGDYMGDLTLVTNDPAQSAIGIPVTFHVGSIGVAELLIDPSAIVPPDYRAWLTARIELPDGYDPADVLWETGLCNGVVLADSATFDPAADFNNNGIPDFRIKFPLDEVHAILPEGDLVEVVITGEIRDTTYFVATGEIRVVRPTLINPNGGEIYPAGDVVTIAWSQPPGWPVSYADLTYTPDDGETWTPIATGLTGNTFAWTLPPDGTDLARVQVYIYDGDGMLGFDSSDEVFSITNILVSGVGDLPTVYSLNLAYPNPFNPMTKIGFDLPKEGRTKISIYDIRGRRVRVLLDEHMTAGSHDVTWFGKDDGGRQMASGVYFYRIESREFTSTKRMTLIK